MEKTRRIALTPLAQTHNTEAGVTLRRVGYSTALTPAGINLMEKSLSNYEPFLSTAAVAKWLGVSTRAVCLWAECKELPAIKIGRQWRFKQEALSEWLRSPRAR